MLIAKNILMVSSMIYMLSHVLLCSPMDWCWPGSSVHEIFQVGVLEWVSSFRGSFWLKDQTLISWVSCIGRQVLYQCSTGEAPFPSLLTNWNIYFMLETKINLLANTPTQMKILIWNHKHLSNFFKLLVS